MTKSSLVAVNLTTLADVMSKGLPVFINGVFASFQDLLCLVKNINRGVNIATIDNGKYILIKELEC